MNTTPILSPQKIPPEFEPLLQEFGDVFPDDLPTVLPPLRNVQHHIDLVPDVVLPNRAHYL